MDELKRYYEDLYKKMLGVNEVPPSVWDVHYQAQTMLARLGGGEMAPTMLINNAIVAGFRVKSADPRHEEELPTPKTPPPKVQK